MRGWCVANLEVLAQRGNEQGGVGDGVEGLLAVFVLQCAGELDGLGFGAEGV